MALVPYRGSVHIEWFPKTASTAFAFGDAVTILSSVAGVGTLIPATSSSPSVIGTIQRAVVAADADYASASMVPVLVGEADTEWLCQCATTSAATTDQGEFVDLTDAVSLNTGAVTYGVAQVMQVLSTTSCIAKIVKKSGPAITTA